MGEAFVGRPWVGAETRRYLQSRDDASWVFTMCVMRWYYMFGIDIVGVVGDRGEPDSACFWDGS